jgi:hypothetical protein
MNLSWVPGILHTIASALKPVASHVERTLATVVSKTGEEAHALVNHLGHYAVVTAKEVEEGIQHLYDEGFHHVATAKPAEGQMLANTSASLQAQIDAAVRSAVAAATAQMKETVDRVMVQRDNALAQLAATTPATAPAPTPAPATGAIPATPGQGVIKL